MPCPKKLGFKFTDRRHQSVLSYRTPKLMKLPSQIRAHINSIASITGCALWWPIPIKTQQDKITFGKITIKPNHNDFLKSWYTVCTKTISPCLQWVWCVCSQSVFLMRIQNCPKTSRSSLIIINKLFPRFDGVHVWGQLLNNKIKAFFCDWTGHKTTYRIIITY